MFKINDKTIDETEVEVYEVTTNIKGNKIEDTYNIFIGAMDDDNEFTLDLFTIVPRKVFYKFDFQKKTLINDFIESEDVEVTFNDTRVTESVDEGFFTVTRIGKTLFKLDVVIPRFKNTEDIKYLEVHTHVDLYNDIYKGE